jgi:RNA polymerase sigma-70 factor (ECF subfamily)
LSAVRSGSRDRVREASYEADREFACEADAADRMALEAAMSDLPAEQRACVALCLAADFSHAEASEALSLPLGTVKSHVTRGRARLLQALGGPDGQ